MRFDRIRDVVLTDLDGTAHPLHRVVSSETLLVLIGVRQPRPDRTAAEIAWMVERLPPDVDVIVVWPPDSLDDAIGLALPSPVRIMRDGEGRLQQLFSPDGAQYILDANPALGTLDLITSDHVLFAVSHHREHEACRGNDRTVDLGDMQH